MFLTEHTIAHSVKVANIMSLLAPTYHLIPTHMYILGLLHDIGKLNTEGTKIELKKSEGHAYKGGELLKGLDFPYWQEVFFHGHPEHGYKSPAMDLLNSIDLSVNSEGIVIDQTARLYSISRRYGETSDQYARARMIIDNLKEENYSLWFPSALRLLQAVQRCANVEDATIHNLFAMINGDKYQKQ